MYKLNDYSHIKITGKDAKVFLQGQITCDINEITNGLCKLAAHCNSKGRMVSLFRIFYFNEAFYLLMPTDIIDIAMAHLKKYAIFSKVDITKDTNANYLWFITNEFDNYADQLNIDIPTKSDQITHIDNLLVAKIGTSNRYFVYIATENLPIPKASDPEQSWNWHEINAGYAFLNAETTSVFMPIEIELAQKGGVSLNKGCYLGQEIIARLHYLGKSKKQMKKINITELMPNGGNLLDSDQKIIGQLICTAKTKDNGYIGLASLKE